MGLNDDTDDIDDTGDQANSPERPGTGDDPAVADGGGPAGDGTTPRRPATATTP